MRINPNTLIAIPVHNEADTAERVLSRVRDYAGNILVIDDGSTDGTGDLLAQLREPLGINLLSRAQNAGYGQALIDAFAFAAANRYEWVVTMDCDEQHEPERLPAFAEAIAGNRFDIISGSRYLNPDREDTVAPPERRAINHRITGELNERLGLSLTDGFCGFKAHRVSAMRQLNLTQTGYAFPMQFWVQAVAAGLRIGEIPVELIYTEAKRRFGGGLDDHAVRLNHYRRVLHCTILKHQSTLPASAFADLIDAPCEKGVG